MSLVPIDINTGRRIKPAKSQPPRPNGSYFARHCRCGSTVWEHRHGDELTWRCPLCGYTWHGDVMMFSRPNAYLTDLGGEAA